MNAEKTVTTESSVFAGLFPSQKEFLRNLACGIRAKSIDELEESFGGLVRRHVATLTRMGILAQGEFGVYITEPFRKIVLTDPA